MTDARVDLDAYFERVGFAGAARADLATLRRLHALHAEKIAFENLSPFLGEPVKLDLHSLQKKLVRDGRGGWCFEQNLLFAQVLADLGFDVTRLAARVRWNVAPDVATARSHMLMRVALPQGDYIADVGFGGLTLTAPLKLAPGLEQATPHEPHRITAREGGYLLEAKVAGEWQALYTFELNEQQLADYEVSNWYLCNHPDSHFLKGLLAARAAPEARHALRNARYAIHYPDGKTEKRFVASAAEYRALLEGPFQIRLPDAPHLDAKLRQLVDSNPPA
jgi:N-hydroxyarylamine O-acetyltransferase